jgi:hypothetical protein
VFDLWHGIRAEMIVHGIVIYFLLSTVLIALGKEFWTRSKVLF